MEEAGEREYNEFKHFTCMYFLFVLVVCAVCTLHSEMSPIVKLCTIADDAVGKLSTGNEQFSYNFIHSNGIIYSGAYFVAICELLQMESLTNAT